MKSFNRFAAGSLMEEAGAAGSGGGGLPPATTPPQPDPAIARMQADLAKSQNDVKELRKMIFAPPPGGQPPPNGQGSHQSAPDKATLNREFIKEPVDYSMAIATRAANETINRTLGPAYDTLVEQAKQLARADDPELFDKYFQEIQANVDQVEPHLKTSVNVWRNGFAIVKGQHVREIIEAAKTAAPRGPGIIIRDAAGPSHSDPAHKNEPKEKVTDEEHRVAVKFRMTDEQYLQRKKENLTQTDFILNPLGPSSWDGYVTFDSRDKRAKEREERRAAANKARGGS